LLIDNWREIAQNPKLKKIYEINTKGLRVLSMKALCG
jgi:hypothetical protein